MFRRRPGNSDETEASAYSRRFAATDSIWTAQDRVRSGFGRLGGGLATGFERVGFALQKRAVWPLQDRTAAMGSPARALFASAAVLLTGGALAAGLLVAKPDGSSPQAASAPLAVTAAPAGPKELKPRPAEPTLQGAAPVFAPVESAPPSEVDPAKAIVKSAPAEQPAEAGAAQAAGASSSAVNGPEVNGPPAGAQALAVARDFANAFVLYETGETDSEVRQAFGETATPALSRALLERPPRLPADVDVPKAKVVNLVPAPSRGDIYPVSVSLLRVGLTSELRLDMEQRKGEGWRVANVLG